jgi:hypothetical protein
MIIYICASMKFCEEMVNLKNILEKKGHNIILPENTIEYANKKIEYETSEKSIENKISKNLFKYYFEIVKKSDAILVANFEKNNIENYIGGNTLIEMSFAKILDKKIFLLNDIPKLSYSDEIIAMQPIIINNNLELIN